uniref:Putative ovule protein n=1 Tax=Solanum chacoense TaxID=4108 RepID=A0A0V0GLS1_SOLCH
MYAHFPNTKAHHAFQGSPSMPPPTLRLHQKSFVSIQLPAGTATIPAMHLPTSSSYQHRGDSEHRWFQHSYERARRRGDDRIRFASPLLSCFDSICLGF